MENKDLLESLGNTLYRLLIDHGYAEATARPLNLIFNVIIVVTVVWLLDRLLRKLIIKAFQIFSNKTKTTYDDFLAQSKFPKYTAHIVPLILFEQLIPYIFTGYPGYAKFTLLVTDIYLIFVLVWIFRSFVRSSREYAKTKPYFKDKPIDSYAQVVMIIVWIIALLFIYSEITNESVTGFLATLGAASAVILLIFRDTILGFVASIQVSVNDMVRVGDWISMDKYGADGDVTAITLTTVKVQNFDNTITTIPTYALISDSFRNWRGMQVSGGRRIKRAIILKSGSVRFLTEDDLKKFSRIQSIAPYIKHRQDDIDAYNKANDIDKSLIVNGRNQTNLGVFRKYCDLYLQNHPAINKDLMFMTRHLAPTPQGIPLEVYAFSSDKRWENYERIMADIFEHIIAAVPYFDLELFETPSGTDVKSLKP
ncbi:mechanosensitive ion channel family protein [Robertkochia aurantiaca]|uniref:mechanosensitive ion channel family protein n=1 Tax=Robertkochia aurantiaca TaxID=2873700 RepID=UPI001CCCFEAF|nr:mechanosensitive ion channel domain-containing protein [Robertkochia sp. 3YJGBD-33]